MKNTPVMQNQTQEKSLLQFDETIMALFKAQNSLPEQIDKRTQCDINDMGPFLPDNPENIIDLGCGSGRLSVGLFKKYPQWNATFWLVDGESSDLSSVYWGQYENDGHARFYNQSEITERLCMRNGLKNYRYILVNKNFEWEMLPPKSDLLFSNRSIGWHFPINIYEDVFPRILKDDAICFFTWYKDLKQTLPDYFKIVTVLEESFQGRDLLVVRYKK